MIRWFKRATRAFGREDGNATVEFVIVLPILFSIFMMSFESGLLMMRSVLLERATDITMRELRTGNIPNPNLANLKTQICDRTVIINNCTTSIAIWMEPISQVTWAFPPRGADCIDRAPTGDIDPSTEPDIGSQNELMLVRVCVLQRAIFPTLGLGGDRVFIGLGAGLTDQNPSYGEYGLVATSSFVNEPS